MNIRNAVILCEDGTFQPGSLHIQNGKIASIGAPSGEESQDDYDAEGMFLLPGFIDTHNHGFCGTEFASPDERLDYGLLELAKRGITSVCPTIRTLPKERLLSAIRNLKREKDRGPRGAVIRGINIEGPFISPKRLGSMNPNNLSAPNMKDLEDYIRESDGLLKTMTFAPELPTVLEMISYVRSLGINASIGHTCATYEEARCAVDSGANLVTHLFNAMTSFHHRSPGVVGEALTDDRLTCELICDYIHNEPAAVNLAIRSKGYDKIVMISDNGVMSGLGNGEYIVEGKRRIVDGNVCKTEDGIIAGSVCDLSYGVQNLLKDGYPISEVSKMASMNPAKILGIQSATGSISVGKDADFLLMDREFHIRKVWVHGDGIQ